MGRCRTLAVCCIDHATGLWHCLCYPALFQISLNLFAFLVSWMPSSHMSGVPMWTSRLCLACHDPMLDYGEFSFPLCWQIPKTIKKKILDKDLSQAKTSNYT